jgi:hypothetical protein
MQRDWLLRLRLPLFVGIAASLGAILGWIGWLFVLELIHKPGKALLGPVVGVCFALLLPHLARHWNSDHPLGWVLVKMVGGGLIGGAAGTAAFALQSCMPGAPVSFATDYLPLVAAWSLLGVGLGIVATYSSLPLPATISAATIERFEGRPALPAGTTDATIPAEDQVAWAAYVEAGGKLRDPAWLCALRPLFGVLLASGLALVVCSSPSANVVQASADMLPPSGRSFLLVPFSWIETMVDALLAGPDVPTRLLEGCGKKSENGTEHAPPEAPPEKEISPLGPGGKLELPETLKDRADRRWQKMAAGGTAGLGRFAFVVLFFAVGLGLAPLAEAATRPADYRASATRTNDLKLVVAVVLLLALAIGLTWWESWNQKPGQPDPHAATWPRDF